MENICKIYLFIFTLYFKVLLNTLMENNKNYLEDLRIIKKVMEESSRFLSLSGLSGVFAGLIALFGAASAVLIFLHGRIILPAGFSDGFTGQEIQNLRIKLIADAILVLVLAVGISFYFSRRKSVKKGLKMWTPVSKRLIMNFLVPLITGGLFILILYFHHNWYLIIPTMLVFYGLALVGAGKFTYSEVFYLGVLEVITGLTAAIFPAFGILFWCFGFGVLHITYGLIMYRKYEE
jgi:hypothetical protein